MTNATTAPGDVSALRALIEETQTLLSGALANGKIGNAPGQYPQREADALNAAIVTARSVLDNPTATQEAIDAATANLQQAAARFKNSANAPDDPDPGDPEPIAPTPDDPGSDDPEPIAPAPAGGRGGCDAGFAGAAMGVLLAALAWRSRAGRGEK
jgi:hypothetical protein